MHHTKARCGHLVVAVGAEGSLARLAQEQRTCDHPRCKSGLSDKFSVGECEAYCRLHDMNVGGWVVDLVTKEVRTTSGRFKGLIEFARHAKSTP